MFSASINSFNHPSQGPQARHRSKESQLNSQSQSQGLGYGCVVYQDYLVLLGTTKEAAERGESMICAYNLKEKRPQEATRDKIPIAIGSCTGSLVPNRKNLFIFYGTIESKIGRPPSDSPSHRCSLVSFRIEKGRSSEFRCHKCQSMHGEPERLLLDPLKDPSGPGSALSVCKWVGENIYVYDPSPENANFGSLYSASERGGRLWHDFCINSIPNQLNEPSQHALFVGDVLYIFAANGDFPSETVETGYSVIEDIYTLDLKNGQDNGKWERVSPSGRAPGAMTNVSLAEANGMVYVFGLSEEESVLWVYNISEKEWKQVRDINALTARPGQKAVIYEGQLLIIEWGYSKDSVEIQYLSLENPTFVEKKLCKDQTENFIQDAKNIFNTKLFPDVIFEVEGEEIPAHKYIIAYRSDYFMKMFNSGMSESHSAKISIPHMKSQIFKALLQYIYCNEVELDVKLALELIPVVDEYLMKGLKNICEKYLKKQLKRDNVVDILIVADRHEIDELKKACFKEILNLDPVQKKQVFMKLSNPLFFEFLEFQTLETLKQQQQQQQQQNDPKTKDKNKEKEEKSSFVQPDGTSHDPFMSLVKRIRAERQ